MLTYLIVLGLGVVLGWKLSGLLNQISAVTSPEPSVAPLSGAIMDGADGVVGVISTDTPSPHPEPLAGPDSASSAASTDVASTDVASTGVASASVAIQEPYLTCAMAHQLGQYHAGFLARTSHELRSPLNRVMSLQQLILADLCDGPEEERDFTQKAYEAAEELLDLLNQTTTVSKLSHGTFPLTLEPTSLTQVLSELAMQTQLHAKNRNLQLTIDLPSSDVQLVADLPCLRQVLLSLVTTPIFLMDEGQVTVTHHIDPATQIVSICVQDQRPASTWSEPIDLLTAPAEAAVPPSAPSQNQRDATTAWGLSLITTQSLVQAMDGVLEVLATPTAENEYQTRIHCCLPLAA